MHRVTDFLTVLSVSDRTNKEKGSKSVEVNQLDRSDMTERPTDNNRTHKLSKSTWHIHPSDNMEGPKISISMF